MSNGNRLVPQSGADFSRILCKAEMFEGENVLIFTVKVEREENQKHVQMCFYI